MVAELSKDHVAAHNRAQRVGTDPDVVFADRPALVHAVERDHSGDVGLGQAELLGAERDPVGRDESFLRLHQGQQWKQSRPRLGVPGDDLGGPRRQVGPFLLGKGHYLSTPPITGSMLATAAMTSATMPPSHIAATDCRFVNDGSRKCARYGLVPPSLTAWQPSSPRGDSTAAYACPAGTLKPSVTSFK